MDWKNLGGKLRRAFGFQAQATPEPLPPATDRFLSARELKILSECVQHIKDITQTNALALKSMSQATPRPLGDEERAGQDALCDQLRSLGGTSLQSSQTALGTCVMWLGQLDSAHKTAVRLEAIVPPNPALPVKSDARKSVADIAVMARGASTIMGSVCRSLAVASPHLDVPNMQRIHEEYREHGAIMNEVLGKLTTLLIEATYGVRDSSPKQTLSLKKK
ncbi:hypothetical protein [Micavibrio aeruginosavorus]|uniref:hypothetical protein n=1 Tax=Micavibrio aeruginosavorus TaxID=349221 RepID=UPI003F4AB620